MKRGLIIIVIFLSSGAAVTIMLDLFLLADIWGLTQVVKPPPAVPWWSELFEVLGPWWSSVLIVLAVIELSIVWAWLRRRSWWPGRATRRIKRGLCPKCCYPTGPTDGWCPECGPLNLNPRERRAFRQHARDTEGC